MLEPAWITDLLEVWRDYRVEPAALKATKDEIAAFERQHNVRLPDDLRECVLRVNGNRGAESFEFDHELGSFLPLAAMKPENEAYPGYDRPGMFAFADHCISCFWWCAHLTSEPSAETPIYFGGDANSNRLAASSLAEFFGTYLRHQERWYGQTPRNPAKPRRSIWKRFFPVVTILISCLALTACHRSPPEPATLRFLIESSPNNLDLRQGTDAQSERVGALIYDPLVHRDEYFNPQPWLAASWDHPDPLTWTFHLRPGVRFHDGHPLTSADVAWSIQSLSNGILITSKSSAFANVARIDTPDPLTLTIHTKAPEASLLFNLSDGLFGVVEQGAGRDEGLHPIGTGPFKFISQKQDKEVVVERNDSYWNGPAAIPRIRFDIIPDLITAALELQKGSADVAANVITTDEVHSLQRLPNIRVDTAPGTPVVYANFNTRDPLLGDPRVRQAIALALDRPALIAALSNNQAIATDSFLPPGHWALAPASALQHYPRDLTRAAALLEAAGHHPDAHGVRIHFTLKTSTDESTRILAEAVQQQLSEAGIALDIRPSEFGTFYSDITKGAFQMYILRWTGASNLDPDIFRYCFSTGSFPPKGANRGFYANPEIDRLLVAASTTTDQPTRRADYIQVQSILSRDLPAIPLWNPNNEVVHTTRLENVHPDPDGSFSFLRTARLAR